MKILKKVLLVLLIIMPTVVRPAVFLPNWLKSRAVYGYLMIKKMLNCSPGETVVNKVDTIEKLYRARLNGQKASQVSFKKTEVSVILPSQAASGSSADDLRTEFNDLSDRLQRLVGNPDEAKKIKIQMAHLLKEIKTQRPKPEEHLRPAWLISHEEKYAYVYERQRARKAAREERAKAKLG